VGVSIVLMEALRATHGRPEAIYSNGAVATRPISNAELAQLLELTTGTHVEPGNRVRMLLNGDDTYPLLWRDLAGARSTIAVQMYYALPGRVSDTLASILCERARAGVRVRLLLDAFGSVSMSRAWLDGMRECGVHAALLRKLQWFTIHSATDRSHVRAVIVDGRVGYTGGFGLADYWLGDGHHADQWRETNVRFEGPSVATLQAAFATAWSEATGEWIVGEAGSNDTAAAERDSATVDAGVLFATPATGSTSAERFFALAIRSARSRLYITNSYFIPNGEFRRLLSDAADRGVDVRVLTVSANTDVKTPWLAGRTYYAALRSHGVRIYEYRPAMMHAKAIAVDGYWSTIGSMNFDTHSLAFNDESNLVVLDSAFGARMDSVFLDDLRYATEMTPVIMARRSWWQRSLEVGAAMLSRIL
jgi:cardiolipin synthase